jgi:hypothetical protein
MHNNLGGLIGITDQQYELLRAIDVASAEGGAKPKSIEQAYKRMTCKLIQKPNLFAQLKDLQDSGFVLKSEGLYRVNKEKIRQSLQKRKDELKITIDECDSLNRDVDKIFRTDQNKMVVQYRNFTDSLRFSAEKLKEVRFYKRPGNIPSFAYSELLGNLTGTTEHREIMRDYCQKGKLKVCYLLSLNPTRAFLKAYNALKDKDLAFREVKTCYDNLAKLTKFPNVEFRYLTTHVESITLYLSDVSNLIALPIRSSVHGLSGFIWIENKGVCDAYTTMFDSLWKNAKPITEAFAKKVAQQKLKELKVFASKHE